MCKRTDYTKEALRQLQDTSTYQPLSEIEAKQCLTEIREMANALTSKLRENGNITLVEAQRMLLVEPKMPAI